MQTSASLKFSPNINDAAVIEGIVDLVRREKVKVILPSSPDKKTD